MIVHMLLAPPRDEQVLCVKSVFLHILGSRLWHFAAVLGSVPARSERTQLALASSELPGLASSGLERWRTDVFNGC